MDMVFCDFCGGEGKGMGLLLLRDSLHTAREKKKNNDDFRSQIRCVCFGSVQI